MSDDENNIIEFRPGANRPRLKKLEWGDKRAACKHHQIEVWAKEPIIECSECGAVVDPYQWLRGTIGRWDEIMATVKWERRTAEDEIKELKHHLRILRKEYQDEKEKRRYEGAVMVLPPKPQVKIDN